MEISEGLKEKILEYKTSKAVSLGVYGNELRHFYQQTYHASVDLGCSGCIGRALTRIIKEQNI
jgi:hypothetical protein